MDEIRPEHARPDGVTDATVEALDALTRGLETIEVARGHLLEFHRLTGTGDGQLRKAVDLLRAEGHTEVAERLEVDLVGRNVLEGRWTFQVIEEYDDTYFSMWREMEKAAREQLIEGRRHVLEAEMEEVNRTHGHPHHTAEPPQ